MSQGIGAVIVFDWSYSIAWYGLVFLVVFALCALVVAGIWRVFSPRLHEASALLGTLLLTAAVLIGNPWWVPGYSTDTPEGSYLRGAFIIVVPIFFLTVLVFCGWRVCALITARRARSGRSSGGRRRQYMPHSAGTVAGRTDRRS